MAATERVRNIVVISDLHCGCQLGLCPSRRVRLDEGGSYSPSRAQRMIWRCWRQFWREWVPRVTHGEAYNVVVNGDTLDGRHHNAVTQITRNLTDQAAIARAALAPVAERAERLYMVRGTEAHVGASGEQEEQLAQSLGAIPDEEGRHARWHLWCRCGDGLCNFAHHIGTTGRTHYETSAVMGELSEMYTEAGRNREAPPDVVVRSHRHRHIEVRVPTRMGYGISFVTAGWQLQTPFVFKTAGGRVTTPQIGGSLIRQGDEELHTRHCVWNLKRDRVEA